MITLNGLPMPPSINAAYANTPKGRIKTKAYRDFEKAMEEYRLKNLKAVNEAKWDIHRQTLLGKVLHVDCEFMFPVGKIICQGPKIQGKPKRLDASNRIKCLEDALSKMLLVDDSYFWSGSFSKRVNQHPDMPEHATVTICFRETL
jgi:Holliday junction resolvase RusA-like endonuclease